MDLFIGTIVPVGFNFAPEGWALCNGQTMAVQQNAALYSLLGTTFGGNGSTTFNLPDLRGRVVVGMGQAPNNSNYAIGQTGGTETVMLTISNLPAHTHVATVTAGTGTSSATAVLNSVNAKGVNTNPGGNLLGMGAYASDGSGTLAPMAADSVTISNITTPLPSVAIGTTGGGQAISTLSPYLSLNYIINVTGIYPVRSN